ncbi:Uncharacterized protein conserved in bacteria, NMA0228-like [Caballeronia glathei]|uniref:UPF0276 protein BG61_23390 n=1 Tax=Caballeronia glathei TaxID=60547 RepID=A0A069PTQ6_9BURK|nr:DUF692 domain-containing protein [Caballeronia glathei]KDR40646.1 hypothetical protein BG61_23390 [Caballeronia glathei]CDY74874.1 Uncharacterized protein conserved in bacteria, NMA0228-like [Caballeronia glathei]
MQTLNSRFAAPAAIPHDVGIGLRAAHYRQILEERPAIGWMEVHSENYFGDGGQPLHYLRQIRDAYPISLHGVGLCLGTTDRIDREHLKRLRRLAECFEPGLVSEHLSWGVVAGRFLNDLLPLPYTEEALAVVCEHVHEAQDYLGRQILIENVSSYIRFRHSTISEHEFIAALAACTGCGILLDVNNVHVNAVNHGLDPVRHIDAMPAQAVKEIHLAGFDRAGDLLIDTHGQRVADPVWTLYRHAVARFGAVPTLIEWDTDIPELSVLIDEAATAAAILGARHAIAA